MVEQKHPADIFAEALDYLWNGLNLSEKGWKRLKKGDFKKKMKNGLTYQIWFCLLYTSPSPRDLSTSRMPSSA